jgi:hypothetical protein
MTKDAPKNFSQTQRDDLSKLGVTNHQLQQLGMVLPIVRNEHAQPKAIADNLREIVQLATELSRKLSRPDKTVDQVVALLDAHFWEAEQERTRTNSEETLPIGKHVSDRYLPRLIELMDAAKVELERAPKARRGRPNTASPSPVRAIHNALRIGWRSTHCRDNDPYPNALKPSKNDTSAFYKIVSICYEAVDGNPDPERAIKAYLKQISSGTK